MKLLIYGSKGWIGQQFVKLLSDSEISFIEGTKKVDNIPDLTLEIETIKPTHIVSFIGRTHGKIGNKIFSTIDYLEQSGKLEENIRDNLFCPLSLALLCMKNNIHLTYLGTGCIFKFDENEHPFGQEKNGFDENSLPNFFGSSYSIVKGFTDRLMHFFDNTVLNIRIRMPITEEQHPRNFITKITNYEYICSIPNSMSVLPELLPLVIDMIQKSHVGTINLTNPGLISHNEILVMFKEIVDPNFIWKNFSKEEQDKILLSDRSNNYLDTSKLQKMYPKVKNIKQSIQECLVKYKSTYIPKISKIQPNLEISYIKTIKNLLVTGGCGFIGSNFINYFHKKYPNINIINVDKLYYCANIENVSNSIRNSEKYKMIKCDINNRELIEYILEKEAIDTVIHFAAQSHVQNSFDNSCQFTKDNVFGTHNLLESCKKYGKIRKFIHVSTDEVYGESMIHSNEKSKTEQSILCPTNPYAATKASAELIAQSYNHSFNMPIIITRGNNVYGPNQYPEKVIPKFIKQLKSDQKITIQGDGSSIRAFLHSYDTSKAFECILDKGKLGEIYNIGCNEGMEYSVLDVAKILIKNIKKTNKYDEWIEYIQDRPFNDLRYFISNKKLKDLGWEITIKFEDGLNELINGPYKIDKPYLKIINNNFDINKYFGQWINNTEELKEKYSIAKPFEHIRIDNFLNYEYAEELFNNFPMDFENWHKYFNPLEIKYANDNIKDMPKCFKDLFHFLSTDELIKIFSKITGIEDLEMDPYLHGAGLHSHPKNGRLHMHLDYEKHSILSNKQRRLNIILFITKDWKEEWNGDNQLWDKEMKECIVKTYPKFNSALIFKTDEISWHGLPEKIKCPEGTFRKSLAYYYISPLVSKPSENKIGNDGSGFRTKATFIKRPEDPDYPELEELYKIRPHRRIKEEDMRKIWSQWNPDIF